MKSKHDGIWGWGNFGLNRWGIYDLNVWHTTTILTRTLPEEIAHWHLIGKSITFLTVQIDGACDYIDGIPTGGVGVGGEGRVSGIPAREGATTAQL